MKLFDLLSSHSFYGFTFIIPILTAVSDYILVLKLASSISPIEQSSNLWVAIGTWKLGNANDIYNSALVPFTCLVLDNGTVRISTSLRDDNTDY